jgi:hypothetical protein
MSIIRQTEVHTVPTGQALTKQIIHHNTWGANSVGSFAVELLKNAMMSSAQISPSVMVDRCIEIADLTFKKFEEKGWLLELPSWDELNEDRNQAGFIDRG